MLLIKEVTAKQLAILWATADANSGNNSLEDVAQEVLNKLRIEPTTERWIPPWV